MRKNIAILLTIVALLVVALLAPLQYGMPATAAPAAIPTPVAGVLPGDSVSKYVVWLNGTVPITQDMRTGCVPVSGFDLFDLQWKSDQGGASNNNTTTLTLHYTNDQVTFEVGPAIVSANTADADDMQQFASFGRFACIDVNVTNSRAVTFTVNALVK